MALTIILVEDEMLIRELAVEDLTLAGFEVLPKASGDDAWALIQTGVAFDLLLTDVRMPGAIDGIELALRAKQLRPLLPVIYATGYTDREIALTPQDRIIRKPYDGRDLLALVAELGLFAS